MPINVAIGLTGILLNCIKPINTSIQMDKWEFYQDASKSWRWRRVAGNGKIVGASSQGYTNKSDCVDNARRNGYSGY